MEKAHHQKVSSAGIHSQKQPWVIYVQFLGRMLHSLLTLKDSVLLLPKRQSERIFQKRKTAFEILLPSVCCQFGSNKLSKKFKKKKKKKRIFESYFYVFLIIFGGPSENLQLSAHVSIIQPVCLQYDNIEIPKHILCGYILK